ncbi:hypothetical protein DL771_004722 [Monosporascus sp. 5C6A]|nr:hypothetical protein DL771_004722 [Monosporascus sp. 5C6A]
MSPCFCLFPVTIFFPVTTTADLHKTPARGSAKKEQETPKPDTPVPVALLAVTVQEALEVEEEANPAVVPRTEARRLERVFVGRGKEDHLFTRSIALGTEITIVPYEEPFHKSNFNLPDSTNFAHKILARVKAGMSDA